MPHLESSVGISEGQIAKLKTEFVPGKPLYDYPIPREEIDRLAPAGLRFFERFAARLRLSQAEVMALLGLGEQDKFPAISTLTQAQFYRLSCIIGIWFDVGALLGNEDAIVRWLRMPIDGGEYAGSSRIDYLTANGLPGFDHVRGEASYWAHNGW